jgi:hypothetical protein
MASNTTAQNGGISFFGALFIVFLLLKLMGITAVAHWSWWWITAPLWAPTVVILAICAGIFVVIFLVALFK